MHCGPNELLGFLYRCRGAINDKSGTRVKVMPHLLAEELRQVAMKCSQLATDCSDKNIANELEGIGVQLAEQARKLDTLLS
jgi:hypothetical protein